MPWCGWSHQENPTTLVSIVLVAKEPGRKSHGKNWMNAGRFIGHITHVCTGTGHVRFLLVHRRKGNPHFLHVLDVFSGQSSVC